MKKMLMLVASVAMAVALTGCGCSKTPKGKEEEKKPSTPKDVAEEFAKAIIQKNGDKAIACVDTKDRTPEEIEKGKKEFERHGEKLGDEKLEAQAILIEQVTVPFEGTRVRNETYSKGETATVVIQFKGEEKRSDGLKVRLRMVDDSWKVTGLNEISGLSTADRKRSGTKIAFAPMGRASKKKSLDEGALSDMAMRGRKLIQGIVQANIERAGKLGPVWPRSYQEEGAESDDVAGKAYKSAADYFSALFDMEHYGTSDWDPTVDGDLLSTLGKNAVVNGKINPAGLDWCIAANVVDETVDFLPVLISANVNPELLCDNQFGGQDSRPLPIGPEMGAPKSMFGDQAIIVVRKSGAAEAIKKKYARYNVFYHYQAFDDSSREHPIVWLTPTGVVKPVGPR